MRPFFKLCRSFSASDYPYVMSLEAENAYESYTTQTCFRLTPID